MKSLIRWCFPLIRPFLSGEKIARLSGVRVGEGCRVLTKRFGSEPFLISIGNRVTISSEVLFVNHDGSGWLVKDASGRRYSYRPISIGDDVFVGARSIVLPGVRVGNRVIIGAGSVVTRSIPDGLVVAGNPARQIATFEEFRSRALIEWTPESDMKRARSYRDKVMAAADLVVRPEIVNKR